MDKPITEASNDLTKDLDRADALGIVRMLRGVDAQIFSGWRHHKGLFDMLPRIASAAALVRDVLSTPDGAVVVCGSGTSGRVGFMVTQCFNRRIGRDQFFYCCSGGDAALLLSDELPEDDPLAGRQALERVAAGRSKVLVVGVSCGLSAPYVAGQLDFALAPPPSFKGTIGAILVGFNPVSLSRNVPIEAWDSPHTGGTKAGTGARSFRDVARAMLEHGERFIVVNPVLGPEAVTGSSRMKGGSATKLLLELMFGAATSDTLSPNGNDDDATTTAAFVSSLLEYERAYRAAYLQAEALADVVALAAEALNAGGHVCYLGAGGAAGQLGVMDASEMPDTYGSPFEEWRGFVGAGWGVGGMGLNATAAAELEGRGTLFRISLDDFERDVMPGLGSHDLCIGVSLEGGHAADARVRALLSAAAGATGCATAALVVADSGAARVWGAVCRRCVVANTSDSEGASEFTLKLLTNVVSTGAQVLAGKVFKNRMINTGPTNNKLYARCVALIELLVEDITTDDAETALLCSIYGVDDISDELRCLPISTHIAAATPESGESQILPTAILIARGSTYSEALLQLGRNARVRAAILPD